MALVSGIRDPGSGKNLFRIPDPGVKKASDPGSGSATLMKLNGTGTNAITFCDFLESNIWIAEGKHVHFLHKFIWLVRVVVWQWKDCKPFESASVSKFLRIYSWKFPYLLTKNCNCVSPRPPWRTSKLQEMPSAPQKRTFGTSYFEIFSHFLFLGLISALLNPDPADQNQNQWIRIRIR